MGNVPPGASGNTGSATANGQPNRTTGVKPDKRESSFLEQAGHASLFACGNPNAAQADSEETTIAGFRMISPTSAATNVCLQTGEVLDRFQGREGSDHGLRNPCANQASPEETRFGVTPNGGDSDDEFQSLRELRKRNGEAGVGGGGSHDIGDVGVGLFTDALRQGQDVADQSDMDVSGDQGSAQNRQKMDFNHVVSKLSQNSVQPGESAPGENSVIIGLCLSRRNNDMGHPDTVSRQTAFEFNALQDRGYKYVSDTDEHGWRAGGGEPGCAYKVNCDGTCDNSVASAGAEKVPSPDTAYLPIIQIDAQSEQQVDLIVHALAKGEVFIPHMGILPESLGVNGTSLPDLVVKFGCERNEDVPPEEWPNWCIEFLHNQLFDYFQPLGAKWSKRPFQMTLAKKVRWKTVKHMNKYFSQCEGVIDSWREQGPQFLNPDAGFIEGGATTEEVAKPHGVYLIRNGAPVNYFAPNYEPPYNSKMARSLLHNVIGKSWDKESRDWHSEPSMKLTANALLSKVCGCQEPNVMMFEEKRVAHFSTNHKTTLHSVVDNCSITSRRSAQSHQGITLSKAAERYDIPALHTPCSATERLSSVEMDEQSTMSKASAKSCTSTASHQSRSSRRSHTKDDDTISISTSRSKSIFEEEEDQSVESESDEESAAIEEEEDEEENSVESSSSEEDEESEANADAKAAEEESQPGIMVEMEEEVDDAEDDEELEEEDDDDEELEEDNEDEDDSSQGESFASQSEQGNTGASGKSSIASVREQQSVLEQKLLTRAEQDGAAKKEMLLAQQDELECKHNLEEEKPNEELERQQMLLEKESREEKELERQRKLLDEQEARQQGLKEDESRKEQDRQRRLLEEQDRQQKLQDQEAREAKLSKEEARIAGERQKLEERLESQRAKEEAHKLATAEDKKNKEDVFRQFPSSHSALIHNNSPAMSELTTGSSFASLQQHRSDAKIERSKSSDSSTVEGAYADMFDMRRKRSVDDESTIGGAYAGMFHISETDDDKSSVASAYAGLYGFGETGKQNLACATVAKQSQHTEYGTSVHAETETPLLSNRKSVASPTRGAAPSSTQSAYSLSSVKKMAIEEEVRKAIQKARQTGTPDRLGRRRSTKTIDCVPDASSMSSQSTKSSAVQCRLHRSEQVPKWNTSVPSAICENSPVRSVISALSRGTHVTAHTERNPRDDSSVASLVSIKSNQNARSGAQTSSFVSTKSKQNPRGGTPAASFVCTKSKKNPRDDASAASLVSTKSNSSLSSERGGSTASRSSHVNIRSNDISAGSKHSSRSRSNVGRLKEVMANKKKNTKQEPSTTDWSPFDASSTSNLSAKSLKYQFKDSSSSGAGTDKSETICNVSPLGRGSGESNKFSVQNGDAGGSNTLSVQTNFDQGFVSSSFGEKFKEYQEGKENAIQTKPKSLLVDKAIQKVLESRTLEHCNTGESAFQVEDAFGSNKGIPLVSNKAGDAAHESRQKRRERRGGKLAANSGAHTEKIHDQTIDRSSLRGKISSQNNANSPQNSLAYSVDDSTVFSGMEHHAPSLLGCVTRSDDCSMTRSRSSRTILSRDNPKTKGVESDKLSTHDGLRMTILSSTSSTNDMDIVPSDEELFAIGWAKAVDPSSGVFYYFTLDRSKTVWENPLVTP